MAVIRHEIAGNERQPLLDNARRLLAEGHVPDTVLEVWWPGAQEWAMRAPIGVAAQFTVEERADGTTPPKFRLWQPYKGPTAHARAARD